MPPRFGVAPFAPVASVAPVFGAEAGAVPPFAAVAGVALPVGPGVAASGRAGSGPRGASGSWWGAAARAGRAEPAGGTALAQAVWARAARLLARQTNLHDVRHTARWQDHNAIVVSQDDVARVHDDASAPHGNIELA